MPSIVGAVKIVSASGATVVQFGDALQIRPVSTSKTYAGAGSFLTGDLSRTANAVSATNTNDPDIQDDSPNQVGGGAGGTVV
ncbi:spore gernimation protein GerPA [Cohnella sp. CFH 77786]|uniref:spore germination protein n=1 Tax=Cohnella sp. CFH 77786 TaxID=2662265 RepID=UPI001C60B9C3|nr:spore germination protein [Cohnella sp. CFH 77786]MBW5446808.1 spore gernimation protein GerPA [Cohnella sp. CFH 77786]